MNEVDEYKYWALPSDIRHMLAVCADRSHGNLNIAILFSVRKYILLMERRKANQVDMKVILRCDGRVV
jgi:hypothetical protein